METEDMINWMLEEAKKNPMKIHHDFDARFRVWVDQIIPSRVNAIRQCKGDMDYAVRMIRLTSDDAQRLQERALLECDRNGDMLEYTSRIEEALDMLIKANNAYLQEVKQ